MPFILIKGNLYESSIILLKINIMMRNIIILLFGFSAFGQKLHHQMLSIQGASVHLSNGASVSQTIGQQSVTGNFRKNNLVMGQGFQQSNLGRSYSHNNQQAIITITYPNPVSDFVNFKFSSEIKGPIKVTIYDMLGRAVFYKEKNAIQNILTIDAIYLAEGEYFIKLTAQNYNYSTKILKTK
jgi:hypothetical protein